MLEQNLSALNCQPVRFAAEVGRSLENGYPEGLNTDRKFHIVFVDLSIATREQVAEMKKLQPVARVSSSYVGNPVPFLIVSYFAPMVLTCQFIFLARSIDLAEMMKEFDIPRDAIVARPIKFLSLYNALIPAGNDETPDRPKMTRTRKSRKIDTGLANVSMVPSEHVASCRSGETRTQRLH
jgi:hypothetical protein